MTDPRACGLPHRVVGRSCLIHASGFRWLELLPPDTLHAVVTDPPYGVKEYEPDQLAKRERGQGGVWRIPQALDGYERSPVPRFTALTAAERAGVTEYFAAWAVRLVPALRPGGHVFVATSAFLFPVVCAALVEGGLAFRGQVIRLVRTLRGGDRPKNAEAEFPDVSSLPRGDYEPWGIFRKPLPPGMTVAECLRRYETGGIRRRRDGLPFGDVIASGRTPLAERRIAPVPALKPQAFLRQLVHAALPLGVGVIADPFAGSGSTVAAAEALGLAAVGVEHRTATYELACRAVPRLAALPVTAPGVRP